MLIFPEFSTQSSIVSCEEERSIDVGEIGWAWGSTDRIYISYHNCPCSSTIRGPELDSSYSSIRSKI